MKEGRSLIDFAKELERRKDAKHDYIAQGTAMSLNNGRILTLKNGSAFDYELSDLGHTQLAVRLNVPVKYWDMLREKHPDLLDTNANYLLQHTGQKHLVRTIDNKARAVLSNSFRCLDDGPFVEAILPPLMASGFEVESCELTETRMYLKVISKKLVADVKKGQTVMAGFWFRNSEVGHSRLAGGLFVKILACLNGMMMSKEYGFARNHSGKALDFSESVEAYYSDATRRLDDTAYWAKLRDIVNGMVGSQDGFKAAIDRFRASTEENITGDPVKAIEAVTETFALTQDESSGVLRALIKGGDLSRWGVSNALTAYSQEVADYDRASDFEAFGGKIIELPKTDWEHIAAAA